MFLHEIVDPAIERGLLLGVVDLAVVIAGNGQYRNIVVRVGLVELSVIIISFAREVDDVADVVAELRLVLGADEMIDQLLRNIVLRGAVLYAAGIADDVKHHPLGILDRVADIRKVFARS